MVVVKIERCGYWLCMKLDFHFATVTVDSGTITH